MFSSTPHTLVNQSAYQFNDSSGRAGNQDFAPYANIFTDVSNTYMPKSVKQLFRWCEYFALMDPLIHAAITKMAAYPVTGFLYEGENKRINDLFKYLFEEVLHLRPFLIEANLDYQAFGNAFVSVHHPIRKMLVCPHCQAEVAADSTPWSWVGYKFNYVCPACGESATVRGKDQYIRATKRMKLIRWYPQDIDIDSNPATGENVYFYNIPPLLANAVTLGRKDVVTTIPQAFIDAVSVGKRLQFKPDTLFHMKRTSISRPDSGWGVPMIAPVLKTAFYYRVLVKAQECVTPDTLIETAKGLIRADDVRVGDTVRTHTGGFHPVEKKWYRDAKADEPGIRVTPTGLRGLPSVYSPGHPILTIGRNTDNWRSDTKERQRSSVILRRPHLYEEFLCPAGQLQVGDYVLYPTSLPQEEQFIDTAQYTGFAATGEYVYSGCRIETAEAFEGLEAGLPVPNNNAGKAARHAQRAGRTPNRLATQIPLDEDFAYVLGWYAGDGSCSARHVQFSVGKNDPPEYADRLKAAVRRKFDKDCTEEDLGSVLGVVLSSVLLTKLIKGLIPGTARSKRIPNEVLKAPPSVKLAFLRGLFEADGCLRPKRLSLDVSSRDLSYDVYRILLSLGCISTIRHREISPSELADGRVIRGGDSYPLTVTTASKERLLALWERGEGPEVVSGKSGFFWKEYFATRICGLEEVEEEQFIDFKIAVDTTFCTPGTATKNCVAMEHIIPMRILYPQASNAIANPYTSVNLVDWKTDMQDQVASWRKDPNYVAVMPYPVGYQSIGGQGRALMLHQEMRLVADLILAGLGVPTEFVFGGLSYSGSSVSLRTMENMFIGMREDGSRLIMFLIKDIARFMRIPATQVKQKPFKMADDLQRAAFDLQLAQGHMIAVKSLLQARDYDYEVEQAQIQRELDLSSEVQKKVAINQAEQQGEAGMVSVRFQAEQQKLMNLIAPPPPQQPGMGQQMPAQPGMEQQMPQGQPMQQGQMVPGQPMPGQPMPGQPGMGQPGMGQAPYGLEMGQDPGVPQPPTLPSPFGGPPGSPQSEVEQYALSITGLPVAEQDRAIRSLRDSKPELADAVLTSVNIIKMRRAAGHWRPTGQLSPRDPT